MRRRVVVGLLCGSLLLGAAGCVGDDPRPPSSPGTEGVQGDAEAVWNLRSNTRPRPSDTLIPVVVTGVACGSSSTMQSVDVNTSDDEVVITITVDPPSPGMHTCELSYPEDFVDEEIDLGEPLGHRLLVDGACGPGHHTRTTTWCDPDGVRFDPDVVVSTEPVAVSGELVIVGGPAGTAPTPVHRGAVRLTGPVARTFPVRAGTWSGELPPGTYEITGRAVGFAGHAWVCHAPVLEVSADPESSNQMDVVCSMK